MSLSYPPAKNPSLLSQAVQAECVCVPWLFLLEQVAVAADMLSSLLSSLQSFNSQILPAYFSFPLLCLLINSRCARWDSSVITGWLCSCAGMSHTHFWRSIALQSDEPAHVFRALWPPPIPLSLNAGMDRQCPSWFLLLPGEPHCCQLESGGLQHWPGW